MFNDRPTWGIHVLVLSALVVCISGFNVTILVIVDLDWHPQGLEPDTTTLLHVVNDVSVFSFWEHGYQDLQGWLVVVDTRIKSCPYHIFESKQLGYISLHPGICDTINNTSVQHLQTVPFDYRKVVVDIGDFSGVRANTVAFIYDTTAAEYHEQISFSPFNRVLFHLELALPRDKIPQMLANLTVKTDVRYVFLIGTSATVEKVLEQAQRLNMLAGRYQWIFYTTDGITPPCPDKISPSILIIKSDVNGMTVQGRQKVVTIAVDVVQAMKINQSSNSACECDVPCEACRNSFQDTLHQVLLQAPGVKIINRDHVGKHPAFSLYNYVGNHTAALMKVGSWNDKDGVDAVGKLFPLESKGIVFRVAAIVEPPFVFKSASGEYYGYTIDVLDAIADIAGFNYTINECQDGMYGYLRADNVWTGCIRNIVIGDSDIIAGALTVTADREAVVDFTLPYYDFAGIQILLKKQDREISLFYFADVFSPLAWLCLGIVIAVTSILLILFDRFAPSVKQARTEDQEHERKSFDLKDSIWFVVGSLTLSGAGTPPDSFSSRLLVAGFWFFSVIIMATFTANLAAFLTVSRMGVTIASMEELAGQSEVKYSVLAESSVMTYFKRMATIEDNFYTIWKDMSMGAKENNSSLAVWDYPLGDKYVNIWKSIEQTGLLNNSEQALQRVSAGNFAFITDSPVIKYLTYRNCEFMAIGDVFSIRPYAFALKEKSIYTKRISSAILELQKKRMLETFKRRWWDEGKKDCPKSSTDQGLDLQSLTGTFIVVAVGITSGFIVLSLEHFWNRFTMKKRPITQVKPNQTSEIPVKDLSPVHEKSASVTAIARNSLTYHHLED